MRLAKFIDENIDAILKEWDSFARSLPHAQNMTMLALRDDAESILRDTVQDMQSYQNDEQQEAKSKGDGGAETGASADLDHTSGLHGLDRASSGFDINEVVSEYRALRASTVRLWRESLSNPDWQHLEDLTRFDEAMDQSLASAVRSYSMRVDDSRKMFLAILSHDLRAPVHSIRMATELAIKSKGSSVGDRALGIIETSTHLITQLINDLIDFATTAIGRSMPMDPEPVDLEVLCHEVIDSYRASHPGRALRFDVEGDVKGVWDGDRLRQVIFNLIGNAIEHGSPDHPIKRRCL